MIDPIKGQETIERARSFIYNSARLLDRMRFAYHFENGSRENVIRALGLYQNEDGGFGQALEPDMRCPDSQPVASEMAITLIKEIDAWDSELVPPLLAYLQKLTLPGGGLPRATTAVNRYGHAPWWATEADGIPALNPTGKIVGMLLGSPLRERLWDQDWFQAHQAFLWQALESSRPNDYHDGEQWMVFLAHAPDTARAAELYPVLDDWLSTPGVIERNPHAEGYVHKVLDYAPTPASYAYRFVTQDEVELHLDELQRRQQSDGGWPIAWPAVSTASEQEWRGYVTVNHLLTLQAYGRL
ncbi:hypothetical protein [Paenibacillus ihumii]|uniref:hypothetical protein n=1 Tax=Paenibacillus ihumii TaxID=687436 RepID=UPI00093C8C19|nr:hypothetical protein [Paenibacillus ihumii]